MTFVLKKNIAGLLLISFLALFFLSVPLMMHDSSGYMSENCLFSFPTSSVCPQDIIVSVLHHISMYNSFFSIQVNYNFILLVISSITGLLFLFQINNISFKQRIFRFYSYISPPLSINDKKINFWLSLLENSPSQ